MAHRPSLMPTQMEYRRNCVAENSYRPNTVPENSSLRKSRDIGPPIGTNFGADNYDARYTTSRLFQTLIDDHKLYSSILHWREPRFPNCNTHTARLRTYLAWPSLGKTTPSIAVKPFGSGVSRVHGGFKWSTYYGELMEYKAFAHNE
jgi:hypothetical protein